MKKRTKITAFALAAALLLSFSACAKGGNDKYRVAAVLGEQELCVAFRSEDKAGDAVIAAMQVMKATGKFGEISYSWFGEDVSLLEGDEKAVENLEAQPEPRVFLVGYDESRLPFSGKSGQSAVGFDIDLAKEAGKLLGWRVKFIPIDISKAVVELNSGNVDCVWGGYALEEDSTKLHQSPVYAKTTIVLASLAGSKIRSVGSLRGKTLTLSESSYFGELVENNKSLKNKPEYIVKVPGGTEGSFKALNSGSAAAIITDLVSLDYYR